jgi:hypothetical protein
MLIWRDCVAWRTCFWKTTTGTSFNAQLFGILNKCTPLFYYGIFFENKYKMMNYYTIKRGSREA